jgi:hypothetical protein
MRVCNRKLGSRISYLYGTHRPGGRVPPIRNPLFPGEP